MTRKEIRGIAKDILSRALMNMYYQLEDGEYSSLSEDVRMDVEEELYKMERQINKRMRL